NGNAEERLGDVHDVIGERDHEPGRADFLKLTQRNSQYLGDQFIAQGSDRALGKICERCLREIAGKDLAQSKNDKGQGEAGERPAWIIDKLVDEPDQTRIAS